MKKTNWLAVSLIVIVVLLVFFWIGSMFGGGYGGYGMMGNRGYGMMNSGYSPFGWFGMGFGMLFMWLIPIGIIALLVYSVVALTRNAGINAPTAFSTSCSNCGKGLQADWKNCPHCGTALK